MNREILIDQVCGRKRLAVVEDGRLCELHYESQGIQGISDLISEHALINLDFADVRTVMEARGLAHMGIGIGKGESRMVDAAKQAISSPMLETSIKGARAVLINITGGPDTSIIDINEAATIITQEADEEANIIFGAGIDENMTDEVKITVIATGFEAPAPKPEVKTAFTAAVTAEPAAPAAEEPVSPIFASRPAREAAPVEPEFTRPAREPAPRQRQAEEAPRNRRGFTPDVPSFLRKKD